MQEEAKFKTARVDNFLILSANKTIRSIKFTWLNIKLLTISFIKKLFRVKNEKEQEKLN
jgi:hypothetical protein